METLWSACGCVCVVRNWAEASSALTIRNLKNTHETLVWSAESGPRGINKEDISMCIMS